MTGTPAIVRARLGAALRALPSDLSPDRGLGDDDALDVELLDVARRLEEASPGLALMMQLRALLIEELVAAARRRGFGQIVTIGCGFDRRPWHRRARPGFRLVEIEHPEVVAAMAPSRDRRGEHLRLAATDFAHEAWRRLEEHGGSPRATRTLVVMQGCSLWGNAEILEFWLARLAECAGTGSEMLCNLMDEDDAAPPAAATGGTETAAAPSVAVRFTITADALAAAATARGLRVLRWFDSRDLQRRRFGVADLLVGEHFAWIGSSGTRARLRRDPASGMGRSWHPIGFRPCLRTDLAVRDDGPHDVSLGVPITALRWCRHSTTRRQAAVAATLDGTATANGRSVVRWLAARGMLAAGPTVARTFADGLAAVTRGADADARAAFHDVVRREPAHLGAWRELAFDALARGAESEARRVRRELRHFVDNAAVAHLSDLLASGRSLAIARAGSVSVVAAAGSGPPQPQDVLRAARAVLTRCVAILGIDFTGEVVIDVASERTALPTTMIAHADPYTLVRIPRRQYTLQLLTHEMTHVLAMCESGWLSEGLAVWMQRRVAPGPCFPDTAGPIQPVSVRPLAEWLLPAPFARRGAAPRLDASAYREAASFVAWLDERGGASLVRQVFAACCRSDGRDFGAVERAVGVGSIEELERAWRYGKGG